MGLPRGITEQRAYGRMEWSFMYVIVQRSEEDYIKKFDVAVGAAHLECALRGQAV